MSKAELKALEAERKAILAKQEGIIGQTEKVFGTKLWEKGDVIAKGMVTVNTPETALPADVDVSKLAKNALYYLQPREEGYVMQLLVVNKTEGFGYAGFLRDAEGNILTDENDRYDIHNVTAKRSFQFGDMEKAVEAGFRTTKAYTAS